MGEIKNTNVIEFDDLSREDFAKKVDSTLTSFEDGDIIKGKVVKIERDEVLVDIGYKSEGVIPAKELSHRKDLKPEDLVSLGDEIEVIVLIKEDKEGRLILSKRRAEYEKAWLAVEEKYKNEEIVSGEVIEIVKGGLIVDIGLRGFLPASLVDIRRTKELESYLNENIEAKIIEMDRNRNNVVLSRRVLLEEDRRAEREEIFSKINKGMRLHGTISSIVDFGVFVDLGGIDGLVHISEISWNHVNHPSEVVSVGDEVDVIVLDVDTEKQRISLGIKQTTEDPWVKKALEFPVDSIHDGKITKIVPFGVFVQLNDEMEGLVHISEICEKHIDSPAQVVHVGDDVKVKVKEISVERRRISLSMREAAEDLGIEIEVDDSLEAKGAQLKKRGETKVETDEAVELPEEEVPAEEPAPEAEEAPAEEPAAEQQDAQEAPAEEEKAEEPKAEEKETKE